MIEKFLTYLPKDPLFIQENNHSKEGNLYGKKEEDFQFIVDEKVDQGYQNYIETWFQETNKSPLQQFLTSYHSKLLVSHVLVCFNTHFSNMNMTIFLILLHTWLYWKYSYT